MSREQSQEFEVCDKCWTLQQHALRSPCYVNDDVTLTNRSPTHKFTLTNRSPTHKFDTFSVLSKICHRPRVAELTGLTR
jgi:hypothetical protein